MAYLALEAVSFTYPGESRPAVEEVSFTLERGAFACLCGATGSGKSTLVRLLKPELRPQGALTGRILLDGVPLDALPPKTAAFSVGYVMQRPDEQIVTDKVWHELAFGLENMGLSQSEMSRRVAETAAYFGIESWYERPISQLSGGQKQLLNLAAVMVMQPSLLILDEPTAQLDPIAASDLIATLHRLNRELGLTVLMIEHRLEEVVPLCNQMLVLDGGRLLLSGEPESVIAALAGREELLCAMPSAARLYHALGATGPCPISLTEGRRFVEKRMEGAVRGRMAVLAAAVPTQPARSVPAGDSFVAHQEIALTLQNVHFRYERTGPEVLMGATLQVHTGELLCLLGGNGSGKSTLLTLAAGLNRAQHGRVDVLGQPIRKNQNLYQNGVALLPQDVQTVFLCDTVREELARGGCDPAALPFDLSPLMDRHPYDLSGGQQQLLALARVLATKPRLLLLDEPTKGLDAWAKRQLWQVLHTLQETGVAILMVTHDVAFAAQYADRCALLFRGQVVAQGDPVSFFSQSLFYTTPISRMTRGLLPGVITVETAAQALQPAASQRKAVAP